MSIPARTIKGLQDIRSHSGKHREAAIPYKAFMRLSCLEMEKFRRERERESAMVRVRNIDARFGDIEIEKAAILKELNIHMGAGPGNEPSGESKSTPAQKDTGGFRFKY